MLGTKSLWPGASSKVIILSLYLNFLVAISIVTPLCLSSAVSSRAQAYLKEPFPDC